LLASIYNDILAIGEVPESFKKGIVFPIYKKGDVDIPENYRGITFNNIVSKGFTRILLNRLEKWANETDVLCENQAGFRKGYPTMDNIFILGNMIKIKQSEKGKKIYGFFVDFKAAFDNVDRERLVYKLYNSGISHKYMKVIKNY